MSRYLVPVLLLGAGTAMSVWSVSRSTEQVEAKRLSQSLRHHQYYYAQALNREDAAIAAAVRALESGKSVAYLHREISDIRAQVADLHGRLTALPVDGSIRYRVLTPLLQQLSSEAAELSVLADLVPRADNSSIRDILRKHLSNHRHSENLLNPALQQIADQYGVARPRTWRGRPLVS